MSDADLESRVAAVWAALDAERARIASLEAERRISRHEAARRTKAAARIAKAKVGRLFALRAKGSTP